MAIDLKKIEKILTTSIRVEKHCEESKSVRGCFYAYKPDRITVKSGRTHAIFTCAERLHDGAEKKEIHFIFEGRVNFFYIKLPLTAGIGWLAAPLGFVLPALSKEVWGPFFDDDKHEEMGVSKEASIELVSNGRSKRLGKVFIHICE